MTKEDKTLLIFSAHPDDHLGCAGTAMKLKNLGFRVVEVLFTGGEKSVNLTTDSSSTLAEIRKGEFEKASKIIGTDKTISLGLPNGNVQRTPKLLDQLIKIIREEKPTVVISESPTDYHSDHRAIGEIVPEAVERAGWGVSKELGERHITPVGLFMSTMIESLRPDVLVDVTNFEEKKEKLLKAYGSQVSDRTFNFSKAVDTYFGFTLRTKAAERFQVMDRIPVRLSVLVDLMGKR